MGERMIEDCELTVEHLQEDLIEHEKISFEFQTENIKLKEEIKIQDKMINLLCKLLEKYGGSVDEICNEVATDDCTLECETCIKDIIRKKVMN